MQAAMTSSDIDFAAVKKIATVALRLIGNFQCAKGLDCIRTRMMTTAIMQAALAIVAIHSQNQKSVGVFHFRFVSAWILSVVSVLSLLSDWYSVCSLRFLPMMMFE